MPPRLRAAPAALSIEVTADYLGVSVSSVWHLLRSGELPKAKIAGWILVSGSTLKLSWLGQSRGAERDGDATDLRREC